MATFTRRIILIFILTLPIALIAQIPPPGLPLPVNSTKIELKKDYVDAFTGHNKNENPFTEPPKIVLGSDGLKKTRLMAVLLDDPKKNKK